MIDKIKLPSARAVRWLGAAETIAGAGTGWPGRFVAIVAEAKKRGVVEKTISLSHVHNIQAAHREVTDDLEHLIVTLAPEAASKLRRHADDLETLAAQIDREQKLASQDEAERLLDEIIAEALGPKNKGSHQ